VVVMVVVQELETLDEVEIVQELYLMFVPESMMEIFGATMMNRQVVMMMIMMLMPQFQSFVL
jgi:hypothetical protein